ncbi:MAG: MFS transporter [Candidatus Acidiferrales bacterium]
MSNDRPRVFYGWWVVLTVALALFLGPPPIMVFSFGVFLKALSGEFHSGRAAISLGFTLHNLAGALCAPLAGRLVDRFGARRVILPSTAIFGTILLSSQLCSGKISQLYVFYLAAGMIGSGAGPVVYGSVASQGFDKRRGLALGLMMFGLGAGALVMPLLAQRLIAHFGWRIAYATIGATALIISLPVLAVFLKDTPEQMGLLPDGTTRVSTPTAGEAHDQGLTWHDAWNNCTFWLLLCAFILVSASVQGCFIHMAAMLSDRGSTPEAAALATSLVGAALLIGRVGTGYLLDRFFAPRIAALIFGAAAVGIALLWATSAIAPAFAAAFLVGLGLGAEVDIIAFLTSRYFGLRSFGVIYGFIFAGFGLAGGLGAYLMGAGFDVRGSYDLPLAAFFIATLVAVLLMIQLGPYPYRVRLLDKCEPEQGTFHPGS